MSTTTSFNVLFESASGFGIFSVLESEDIGNLLAEVIWTYISNDNFMSVFMIYIGSFTSLHEGASGHNRLSSIPANC